MKWFEVFIDSCRDSFELSAKNFKLYLPNLIAMIITGVLIFILFIASIIFGVTTLFKGNIDSIDVEGILKSLIPLIILFLIIVGIIMPVVYCMVEAGILLMCKRMSVNGNANFADFFQGLKMYWYQVLIGLSIVGLIPIILFIPAFILLFLADILTLGYGFISGWAIFNVFFGTWGAIMVVDEISAWAAIKKGYGFGKKNFWILFFIFFSATPIIGITSVLIKAVPLLGMFIAPLCVITINTYFKLVLVKYYYEVSKGNKVLIEPANY